MKALYRITGIYPGQRTRHQWSIKYEKVELMSALAREIQRSGMNPTA
jgi:hypothetical protein